MEQLTFLEKIKYMLYLARDKEYKEEDISRLVLYSKEHSNNLVLGRFMGYSVSDYALATLRWLNTEKTMNIYNRLFDSLDTQRKNEIIELVSSEAYLNL